jgi:hypothetical protein
MKLQLAPDRTVICSGFVRTPRVDKQIPEQTNEFGISEQQVIRDVMLKETVDREFTTVEDVAEAASCSLPHTSRPLSRASRSWSAWLVHAVKARIAPKTGADRGASGSD